MQRLKLFFHLFLIFSAEFWKFCQNPLPTSKQIVYATDQLDLEAVCAESVSLTPNQFQENPPKIHFVKLIFFKILNMESIAIILKRSKMMSKVM